MGADDVTTLHQRIGLALVQAAPRGWVELRGTYLKAGSTGELRAVAVLRTGAESDVDDPSMDLYRAMRELRRLMYQSGKGAWYTAVVTVTSSGSMSFDFDCVDEPEWDIDVVPGTYVEDLELFPRDEEHRPAWLREKLRLAAERPLE